jgi:hypothetical protein
MVRHGWVALLFVLVAPPAQAATPVPRAACVSGRIAVFDVRLAGGRAARVPVGRRNHVRGGHVVGTQPTRFVPGTTHGALRVRFGGRRVAWRLGRRVARLARSGRQCAPAPLPAPVPVPVPPVPIHPPPPPTLPARLPWAQLRVIAPGTPEHPNPTS